MEPEKHDLQLGGRQYVAAVDLLDENEVFLKNLIGLAMLGIQILKVRTRVFQ